MNDFCIVTNIFSYGNINPLPSLFEKKTQLNLKNMGATANK